MRWVLASTIGEPDVGALRYLSDGRVMIYIGEQWVESGKIDYTKYDYTQGVEIPEIPAYADW